MGSWFPDYVTVPFCIVFAVILIVHAIHLTQVRGWARLWHTGHVLMALGMVDMYWPGGSMPVGERSGELIYGALTVIAVLIVGFRWARGHRDALWTLLAIDFAVMTYMFAMMSDRFELLTVLVSAWSLAQAAAWFSGQLAHEAEQEHLTTSTGATGATQVIAPDRHQLSLRITLGLMGVGMAYMQFGMDDMSGEMGGGGHHHSLSVTAHESRPAA